MEDNWKHRNSGMRCSTCIWFTLKQKMEHEDGIGQPVTGYLGRCRRHAPSYNAHIGWPPVFETDWCGDHKLNESKI